VRAIRDTFLGFLDPKFHDSSCSDGLRKAWSAANNRGILAIALGQIDNPFLAYLVICFTHCSFHRRWHKLIFRSITSSNPRIAFDRAEVKVFEPKCEIEDISLGSRLGMINLTTKPVGREQKTPLPICPAMPKPQGLAYAMLIKIK